MSSAIEKRLLSGTTLGIISFFILFVQTVIFVPVFLKSWGKDNFGLWLSINALYSILKTFDNGHQSYVGNELCKLFFLDKNKLKIVLASSIQTALLLGCLEMIISISIVMCGLFGWALGVKNVTTDQFDIKFGFVFLVATWFFSGSVGGILVRMYAPVGLYSRAVLWGMAMQIAQTFGVLITVKIGGGIAMALIVSGVVPAIAIFFIVYDLRKHFYDIYPFWQGGNLKTGLINLRNSLTLTMIGFLLQLQNSGIILAVSSVLGTSVAPILTTLRTLSNMFIQATTLLTQPLFPEMVRYYIQKDHYKLKETIHTSWLVSGLLINIGLLITLPFVEFVYLKWTRNLIAFNLSLYLLLALSVSLKNFGAPLTTYLAGINNLKAQTTASAMQTAIIFGVVFLYISKYSLLAIGMAIVVGELIGSVLIPIVFTAKELKKIGGTLSVPQIILTMGGVMFVGVVFLGISLKLLSSITGSVIGVTSLVIICVLQWKNLSYDVRNRLRLLLYSKFKFLRREAFICK